MRDEIEPDFGALAREYWLALGAADRVRWLDERMAELGPFAPIPEFEDAREDARHWAEGCLESILAIYVDAILRRLSPGKLRAAQRHIDAMVQEGQKAETPGG